MTPTFAIQAARALVQRGILHVGVLRKAVLGAVDPIPFRMT